MNDQNGSFNLNASPTNPVPQATDPLNTGNGLENADLKTPAAIPTENPLAPEPPVSTITTQSENLPNQENHFKKYIIIGLAALLLIGGGAAAYYFYFSNPETTDTETTESEFDNTLTTEDNSEISPEIEELEEVVEDLKDVYSERSDDTSAPPSITIDLSERDIPEEVDKVTKENTEKYGLSSPKTEPTPKKIAR